MGGAIAITVILLIFPVLAIIGGVVAAALLGTVLTRDADARHEGSELIELSR